MTGQVVRGDVEQALAESFAALDHDDLAVLADTLAEDVEMAAGGRLIRGRAEVQALLVGRRQVRAAARHVVSNLRVDVLSPDRVRARYYVTVYHAPPAEPSRGVPHAITEWDDEMVLDADGRWRAARRTIQPVFALSAEGASDIAAAQS